MTIEWSRSAGIDSDSIFAVIEAENPRAADRIEAAIFAAINRLEDFPWVGRAGRLQDTRELVIPRTPYLVIYTITDEVVFIVRIIHAAQDWPGQDLTQIETTQ